jgi:hypothetical protein
MDICVVWVGICSSNPGRKRDRAIETAMSAKLYKNEPHS